MPKPKKGDPELLLVSFCDIVTIVTAALFMAMIIVIDESSRIPSVRPMPLLRKTTNAPVYFECRANQIFPIDYPALIATFKAESQRFKQSAAASKQDDGVSAVNAIMKIDVGNDLYRIDPQYLLMGIMALVPREGTKGTTVQELIDTPTNAFRRALSDVDPKSQFCAFVVRADGFEVFRRARDITASKKVLAGWEMLEQSDRLTLQRIGVQ